MTKEYIYFNSVEHWPDKAVYIFDDEDDATHFAEANGYFDDLPTKQQINTWIEDSFYTKQTLGDLADLKLNNVILVNLTEDYDLLYKIQDLIKETKL